MKTGERPAATITTPRAKVILETDQVIADYRIAVRSRVASELGRREVLVGRAPFGIFGDGKEIANLGMAHAFRPGDWRSGYYRDQTFMLAVGLATLEQCFAQLYADADLGREPFSAGRQMSNHFATRTVDEQGRWRDLLLTGQSASDLSPVGAQMPRSVGLAWASKLYRGSPALKAVTSGFSRSGDEVCFCTSGNAGTSEGLFWESINAAGVLQIPLIVAVWDDGYGISVPNELQTTKGSISKALAGMQREGGGRGFEIRVAKGWDYIGLIDTFTEVAEIARREHVPALVHVIEVTQPQGHSTSGSHERYKPQERLKFEIEGDPIKKMREWMIAEGIADATTLDDYERRDRAEVEEIRERAYEACFAPIRAERDKAVAIIEAAADDAGIDAGPFVDELRDETDPNRKLIDTAAFHALVALREHRSPAREALAGFARHFREDNLRRYTSHLHTESDRSPLRIRPTAPAFSPDSQTVDGRVVLLRCFDANLARDPRIVVLGEDVGVLGDVNLVYEGLQAKYGKERVVDTGIREATILGQGIGAAMRGLRPIVDIQYVDYLLYALEVASDDLSTLHHRTAGGQIAPVVIRTKGHRLQGIWHTGSPMQLILGALRGLRVVVPRDMTQAAGFYNTLLRSDDPAIVIEVLSGYRLKERVPSNVGDFTLPLGVPETIRAGRDITLVTYGALCRIAQDAAKDLVAVGIEVEIIDVRTLLPFDTGQLIGKSVARTGALLVVDEDLPGGASAYILQQVLDAQRAIDHLEVPAHALSAVASRTPVGTDADHFTKPSREDIFAAAYDLMRERDPDRFPALLGDA